MQKKHAPVHAPVQNYDNGDNDDEDDYDEDDYDDNEDDTGENNFRQMTQWSRVD